MITIASRPSQFRQPFDTFVWLLALFGAAWTLFSHAMVLSGANFFTFQAYAPIPLLAFILICIPIAILCRRRPTVLRSVSSLKTYVTENKYVILAVAIAYAINLFIQKWDLDETFYASIPIFTLAHPTLPLLTYDTLHGFEGIPILHPIYRLHSFELLAAYIASVSDLNPLLLLHVVFPLFYTALFLIAWYRLLEYFIPDEKKAGLLVVVLLTLLLGESNQSPGNDTLVRFYEGKCVLGFAVVPLIFYHSIQFLTQPRFGTWLLLSLLSIFGLGLSSSAIFLILITLGIMSLVLWRPTVRQTAVCGLNVLSGWYLLAIGLYMKGQVSNVKTGYSVFDTVLSPFELWAFTFGLAQGILIMVVLYLLLRQVHLDRIRDRILRGHALVVLCLFIPPVSWFLAEHLVSTAAFWRLLWLLPVYLYLTIVFFWLWKKRRGEKSDRKLLITMCVLAFLAFGSGSIMEGRNRTWLAWPGIKIHPTLYSVVEHIHRHQPAGTLVLAPVHIAAWLPWMQPAPKMMSIRPHYFRAMNLPFGEEESLARARLQNMITLGVADSEDQRYDSTFFTKWVTALNVGSVTVPSHLPDRDAIVADIQRLGFRFSGGTATGLWARDYEIFIKTPDE